MRHVRLVSFTDDMTGNTGLKIKGADGDQVFADWTGGLIAHDLIDHQNGVAAIGCPADELEALGAIWHVRGRHGTLMMDEHRWPRCIYETMANDVAQCAGDVDGQGWFPGTVTYRTHAHEYDEDFNEILEQAMPIVRRNRLDDAEDGHPFPLEQFRADALHLLRRGFNKSARRWGRYGEPDRLYMAVKEAVRPYAKAASSLELEGIEYRLSYGHGEARVTPISSEEEW